MTEADLLVMENMIQLTLPDVCRQTMLDCALGSDSFASDCELLGLPNEAPKLNDAA